MSVRSAEVIPKAVKRTAKRRGFWRGLVQRLDALIEYSIRPAVSERERRRVKRCRQLMSRKQRNGGSAILACVPKQHAVRSRKVR